MTVRLFASLSACLFVACSNPSHDLLPPIDGGFGDAPVFTDDGGPTSDGPSLNLDLATDPGGPLVEIQSPMANAEVSGDQLSVSAKITSPSGSLIDATSVQLIVPSTMAPGTASVSMTLSAAADVYTGQIDISALKSGPTEFTVIAADVNGKKGNAKEAYIHDHGPTIIFLQPTAPTAKGSVLVDLLVDDALHPITNVSQVNAHLRAPNDIMLTAVAGSKPFHATGTIDFSKFNPVLNGPQLIRVDATNSSNTTTHATRQFTVDNVGPVITVQSPMAGQFVGGVLEIKASFDDISGIDDSSVVAVFGGNLATSVKLSRVAPDKPDFSGLFDVRQLGPNYVLPEFSVRANDLLGNSSQVGVEIIVDNTRPILSLDPPMLRLSKFSTTTGNTCSALFDPLGEAANDGDQVDQVVTLRARVEDDGNSAPGVNVVHLSGIDPSSVILYAVPATATQALLVDVDGDGSCDDINPLLVPTSSITMSNEALALAMAPIAVSGSADYTFGGAVPPALQCPHADGSPCCDVMGDPSGQTPPPLCLGVAKLALTVGFSYDENHDPALWTLPPVSATPSGCAGFQLDTKNRLGEGPACVAVRAADQVGNVNVSPPLRICVKGSQNLCTTFSAGSYNCTGTLDKTTSPPTVDPNKHCTPGPLYVAGAILKQN
jgi:hypothetical protein